MEKAFQLGASDDEIVAALQESQPILRERAIALAARHLPRRRSGASWETTKTRCCATRRCRRWSGKAPTRCPIW